MEVQVFADTQGNTIHLGERDCSVQRRHQKVVEEAPCPVMTEQLRAEMGAAAVAAAQSINYRGAGTVEFLLDENGKFYFLEMNTRLQVEHPVTELITGLDLVALQLQVAQGEPLGLTQDDITLHGHAIEVRLYTEDPTQDFLPTSGPVDLWSPPTGTGIRVDSGICSGQEISPFYDPMVAKIIASGPTREIARLRLIEALKETVLFGTRHNRDFLVACLEKDCFAAGQATTAFIAEEFAEGEIADPLPGFADSAVAAVIELALQHADIYSSSVHGGATAARLGQRQPAGIAQAVYARRTVHDLSVMPLGDARYQVFDASESAVIELLSMEDSTAHVGIDDSQHIARFHLPEAGRAVPVHRRPRRRVPRYDSPGWRAGPDRRQRQHCRTHARPAAGSARGRGDTVAAGQTLAVLEAMKMHYEIVAEAAGEVTEVMAEAGNQVAADDLLIEIEVEDAE